MHPHLAEKALGHVTLYSMAGRSYVELEALSSIEVMVI
jgi:hypothetical protein